MCIRVDAYMHMYICICIYAYMHLCLHIYIYIVDGVDGVDRGDLRTGSLKG